MNKFLKKLSTFFVFILLINMFSIVIWAIIDINGEKVDSEWLNKERDITLTNKDLLTNNNFKNLNGSYDKINENYTLSVPTHGYIGISTSGKYEGMTNDNKEKYIFDIDEDGTDDYLLKVDSWKITVPLVVPIVVAPFLNDSTRIISPVVKLVNEGEIAANVYIKEMTELGNNGIKFVNKDKITTNDDLYLAVISEGNVYNDFEKLQETSLAQTFNNKDNPVLLGTLQEKNKNLNYGETGRSGKFLFYGKATREFLTKHRTILDYTDENTKSKNYRLSYKFEKPKTN